MVIELRIYGIVLLALLVFNCQDTTISLESMPAEQEVIGNWLPLFESDTLTPYIRVNNQIYYKDSRYDIARLAITDTLNFQVWTGSSYARDSSTVYYPIEEECVVIDSNYVCYITKMSIKGAYAPTFRYLGSGYGTDGKELYYRGELVRGSNNEGF